MTAKLQAEACNLLLLLLGSMCLALGVVLFLAPNRIATGGAPGLAILFNHLFQLPIGSLLLLINLPLLLAGWKLLGRAFVMRSVGAILLTAQLSIWGMGFSDSSFTPR